MSRTAWILALTGAGALFAYLIVSSKKSLQLIIAHNEFGTTNPEIGTVNYLSPTQVTIQATPMSGYQTNWTVNGQDVATNVNSYSLYIDGFYAVSVNFVPIQGGEVGPIEGVKPVGSVGLLQNFRFWYGNAFAAIDIAQCNESWVDGICQSQPLSFKVYDAGDRGVPNVQVRIYPDLNPDSTSFKGRLVVGGQAQWDVNNPIVVTTDANGIATINIFNEYTADDWNADGGGIELSRGTGLGVVTNWHVRASPVWHGWAAGIGSWIDSNFGGGTIGPISKIIRAEVVGSTKATVQNIAVSYGVKWQA